MRLRDREFPDRLGARRKLTPRSSRPARIRVATAACQAPILGAHPITFPLASTQAALREVRAVLDDVAAEPRAQGHSDRDRLPGGNTDESSAAALLAGPLAKEVDFFPIGTNEVTQYTLAVDQTNDTVADPYCAAEPAVLRSSATAVDAARR
jgi:phosphotransferase system enzyme I (PtsI)